MLELQIGFPIDLITKNFKLQTLNVSKHRITEWLITFLEINSVS